jgi:hypothetical protein
MLHPDDIAEALDELRIARAPRWSTVLLAILALLATAVICYMGWRDIVQADALRVTNGVWR